MNKAKYIFICLLLLMIAFVMVFLSAIIYRANERSSIKSYIFQMGNYTSQRVGEIQNIKDLSAGYLRNKLIKKYISEYFKIIPGETVPTDRKVLRNLSSASVFEQWKNSEAKTITELSAKNTLRIVNVHDTDIAMLNNTKNTNTNQETSDESVYYIVHYHLLTWPESNKMLTEPTYDKGTIYMEISFEPGLREHDIYRNKINIKKYLKTGGDPVALFRFQVTNIGSKAIK